MTGGAAPESPPPRFVSPAEAGRTRGQLAGWGFHEEGLRAAFGVGAPRELFAGGRPAFLHRTRGAGALPLLVRLFLAGLDVPGGALREALGPAGLAGLAACGLLDEPGDGPTRARAALTPFEGLLLAFDRPERHAAAAADFTLGPGPATRRLADLRLRRPGGRVLDLGCGSGALACLAARDGARVTGVDVNARALAFARFNAQLNGLEVEWLEGDLFGPVAGRRFDLVLCNPPYVISPASTFVYRDGPPGLCARIAREAAAQLAEGGLLLMVCHWPVRAGPDPQATLRQWLEPGGGQALVLQSAGFGALDYACLWLGQQHDDEPAYARELEQWLAFYEREGIEAVGDGLVLLRRSGASAPGLEVRPAPVLHGPAGDSLEALLAGRDAAQRGDQELLGLALRLAPGVELSERRRPGTAGWERAAGDLRQTRGFAFAARLDPLGAALAGFLDGTRSLRQAAEALATSAGLEVEPLLPGLPDLARRLLRLGLLLPPRD